MNNKRKKKYLEKINQENLFLSRKLINAKSFIDQKEIQKQKETQIKFKN